MAKIYNLYLDDSGTRHPDRKPGRSPAHGYDYFALGGILIEDSLEETARTQHEDFCAKWDITAPLHSSEIRSKRDRFAFLGALPEAEQTSFREELYQLMRSVPVTGFACVIDRPGYNARYNEKYGRQKWDLCKTAFSICVERAAKYVLFHEGRMRVFVERSDKNSDQALNVYYREMLSSGMPFDSERSDGYNPLRTAQLSSVLYDFKTKQKTSPMVQLADLYLWPMCMGGYDPNNLPYKRLMEDKKLIDSIIEECDRPQRGIKYSCWDLRQKN